MKFKTALVAGSLALTTVIANAQDGLETEQQKYSYMFGMEVGQQFQKSGLDLDSKAFAAGLEAILTGQEPLLNAEQVQQVRAALMQKMQQQQAAQAGAAGEKNKMEGEKFLAENKARDGVMITDSGLQYEVVKEGDGDKPSATDTVSVHYKGTLIDGTEFDSSYSRGEPATFPLNGVIPGWTEGLQLMATGSTYRFYIPSHLAYGPRGAGGKIGPNSTLIFDVELLEIK